jgi:exodeoxyribonuclease III
MKLLSWNVNGLRAVSKNGFLEWLAASDADVVCLQEIKCKPEQWIELFPQDYRPIWNSAVKPGYSGTLTLLRQPAIAERNGIGENIGDAEGRVITVEYPSCYLVNVYTPNARSDLSRLDYRTQVWDRRFRKHCLQLENHKPVIFTGDLNVAHEDIDLANPRSNRGKAGFTDEERAEFTEHLKNGYLDTFRHLEQGPNHYSWWSYRAGARSRNVGWRIDYFCISDKLKTKLKRAWIEPHVQGSDHCPVGLELDL